MLNPPKVFKWDSQSTSLFASLINNPNSQAVIKTLSSDLQTNCGSKNFQNVTQQFTDFINERAEKICKKKPIKGTKRNHTSKAWYSETFKIIKRQFEQLAKHAQKKP